jgi:AcrR family transcriptional regulator
MAGGKDESGEKGSGLHRLPPGRHGLPREVVARNQRDRIVAAMIRTVAAKGFAGTTVKEVGSLAAVSRSTFYEYFKDKDDCFLRAYGIASDFLIETVVAAGEGERGWPATVRARVRALLAALAANPDLVRLTLIAPGEAGGEIADARRSLLEELRRALAAGTPAGAKAPSDVAEEGMIGGLAALVVAKVEAGEGEELEQLAPDIVELVLAPYLGRTRAAREARR